ncbi:hypothetical protein ACQR0V_01940 [Bradyrhizobium sp. HKCCYLS2058]|uniref:hypothetical protein n=2 Tax=Nitrobacteraceae TaxID=41294 RepID=UPI002915EEF8|nr:hypothetical protein [Bradyrhizobium sp. SZCCHNR1015]
MKFLFKPVTFRVTIGCAAAKCAALRSGRGLSTGSWGLRDVRVGTQGRGWRSGRRALVAGLVVFGALALAGCSSPIADMPSLDADAVARPKEPGGYLPVNDVPRDRDAPIISPQERDKIEKELLAARDRQASAGTSVRPK